MELQKLGINVANELSKTVLHQLYLENVKPKVVEEVSSGNNNIDMEMTSDQDVSLVRDSYIVHGMIQSFLVPTSSRCYHIL